MSSGEREEKNFSTGYHNRHSKSPQYKLRISNTHKTHSFSSDGKPKSATDVKNNCRTRDDVRDMHFVDEKTFDLVKSSRDERFICNNERNFSSSTGKSALINNEYKTSNRENRPLLNNHRYSESAFKRIEPTNIKKDVGTYEVAIDREWYDCEEDSTAIDMTCVNSPDNLLPPKTFTSSLSRIKPMVGDPGISGRKISLKKMQFDRDNEKWETTQMIFSGVVSQNEGVTNLFKTIEPPIDEDHRRIQSQLIFHEDLPTYLLDSISRIENGVINNGLVNSTNLTGFAPVQPIKDPTSDMAVISRKGSLLVKSMREKRERQRQFKSLSGAGTHLGVIMGVEDVDSSKLANSDVSLESKINDKSSDLPSNDGAKLPETFKNSMKESHASSVFSQTKSIRQQREFLPAFACRQDLLRLLRENQVVIVVGETGSGKTTQLAQYMHEEGYTKRGMIGCTQPRRVAAMSVAKRVSDEVGCVLGDQVGYAIRFEDCTTPGKTLIKFMTDGVLLRETLRDPEIYNYSVIIIDEAHERSLQTDVLLGLLKRIVVKRRDLKVIVTSATMDAGRFASFFGHAPVFTIPGRTFPVEVMYTRTPCEDYVDAAVKQVLSVHLTYPPGDILVFMTGQEDIEATAECVRERLDALVAGKDVLAAAPSLLIVLPIYSQLPADLQAKIFDAAPRGQRKCIIATNIAETSLTVDGVCYVIDCGYSKVKVYNARIGMDALQVYPASQAACNQRAGRAGRTGPGTCFRLFTESSFRNEMFSNNIPEIQRTNLANVVLILKSLGIKDILRFDFIDPPPLETLTSAMHQLWALGSFDDTGSLTPTGRSMIEYPLDPPLAKMIISASKEGCLDEILSLVSMLSLPTVFFRPKERIEESDAARERLSVPESDHLTLLNVYRLWKSHGSSDSWCSANFVHPKAMRRAAEVRQQLVDILNQQGVPITTCGAQWDCVRRCIASAYILKTARAKTLDTYYNMVTGMQCALHPTSALFGLGYTPEYVVYHELIMTSKEFMQCATAVDPRWLAEACPILYSLRVTSFDTEDNVSSKILNFKENHDQHCAPTLKTDSKHGVKQSTGNIIKNLECESNRDLGEENFIIVKSDRAKRPKRL